MEIGASRGIIKKGSDGSSNENLKREAQSSTCRLAKSYHYQYTDSVYSAILVVLPIFKYQSSLFDCLGRFDWISNKNLNFF